MLTTLTEAQIATMASYRDRWLRIGLATGPVDQARAQAATRAAYTAAGLRPPQAYIYTTSPIAGGLVAYILQQSVRQSVQEGVEQGVWQSVRQSVRQSVEQSVRQSVEQSVRQSVWQGVEQGVWQSIWQGVRQSVWQSVEQSIWQGARQSVQESVWQGVEQSVQEGVWQGVEQQIYGSMDAGWLSLYNYFLEVCGLACCEPLRGLMELADCCGWWAPYKNMAILQARPALISVDGQGRLHNDSGMAVRYSDDWGIYAWHGVLVDPQVIEAPDTITLEQVVQADNAEIQRILLERYGWERYMDETAALLRDCDTEPTGAPGLRGLYQCTLQSRVFQVLVCCCASTGKTFYLEVPPEVETCEQAAAWLANTAGKPLALLVRT